MSEYDDLMSGKCSPEWARYIAPKVLAAKDREIVALRDALADIASQPITGEDASAKHARSYDSIVKLARVTLLGEP